MSQRFGQSMMIQWHRLTGGWGAVRLGTLDSLFDGKPEVASDKGRSRLPSGTWSCGQTLEFKVPLGKRDLLFALNGDLLAATRGVGVR